MVKIVRDAQPDGSVKWSTGLQPLADIANVEHFVPRDWISEDGCLPNEKFVEYARPLIEGEVKTPSRRRPAQIRRAREEQGGEETPATRLAPAFPKTDRARRSAGPAGCLQRLRCARDAAWLSRAKPGWIGFQTASSPGPFLSPRPLPSSLFLFA